MRTRRKCLVHKCTTARWKILRFLLVPVVEQTHLILTWSETSKTGHVRSGEITERRFDLYQFESYYYLMSKFHIIHTISQK